MGLRSGSRLNSSLSARILYFAASSSEKNVAHSKDNTNSTHLKTAEMLKNIEIVELVDLSPEVGRVLQSFLTLSPFCMALCPCGCVNMQKPEELQRPTNSTLTAKGASGASGTDASTMRCPRDVA